jgi:hypothetical protein
VAESLPERGAPVSLRAITRENLRDFLRLEVSEGEHVMRLAF